MVHHPLEQYSCKLSLFALGNEVFMAWAVCGGEADFCPLLSICLLCWAKSSRSQSALSAQPSLLALSHCQQLWHPWALCRRTSGIQTAWMCSSRVCHVLSPLPCDRSGWSHTHLTPGLQPSAVTSLLPHKWTCGTCDLLWCSVCGPSSSTASFPKSLPKEPSSLLPKNPRNLTQCPYPGLITYCSPTAQRIHSWISSASNLRCFMTGHYKQHWKSLTSTLKIYISWAFSSFPLQMSKADLETLFFCLCSYFIAMGENPQQLTLSLKDQWVKPAFQNLVSLWKLLGLDTCVGKEIWCPAPSAGTTFQPCTRGKAVPVFQHLTWPCSLEIYPRVQGGSLGGATELFYKQFSN